MSQVGEEVRSLAVRWVMEALSVDGRQKDRVTRRRVGEEVRFLAVRCVEEAQSP
jgi:hypothetical protein